MQSKLNPSRQRTESGQYLPRVTKGGTKGRFTLNLTLVHRDSGRTPEDSGYRYNSPVLGLKGGLWVLRKKSQKFSTASDQYILSYVKKLQGGGKFSPPPGGIGLKNAENYSN